MPGQILETQANLDEYDRIIHDNDAWVAADGLAQLCRHKDRIMRLAALRFQSQLDRLADMERETAKTIASLREQLAALKKGDDHEQEMDADRTQPEIFDPLRGHERAHPAPAV